MTSDGERLRVAVDEVGERQARAHRGPERIGSGHGQHHLERAAARADVVARRGRPRTGGEPGPPCEVGDVGEARPGRCRRDPRSPAR